MSRKLNSAMLRAPFHDLPRGLFSAGQEEGTASRHCVTFSGRKRYRGDSRLPVRREYSEK
jgi:hypothetical protein